MNFRQYLGLFLLFLTLSPLSAQNSDPILKIQSGGHMSRIREVLVTPDKKEIITVSDDKTIKIWSAESGTLIEELNGEIDAGWGGLLYAAALSPDGRLLAVGGYMAIQPDYNSAEYVGAVRLYDYKSRTLIKIIQKAKGTVSSLRFTQDGKQLLVASDDNQVDVWNLSDYSLHHTFTGHTNRIYEIDVLGDRLVTASFDKTVKLWSLKDKKLLKSSALHTHYVDCVDFSPDGQYIVSGSWDEQIIVYNKDLKPLQIIQNQTQPWSLAFSPDSKLLIAGTYNAKGGPDFCNLYTVAPASKKPLQLIHTYRKHEDVVISNVFIDNHTIVTTGGVNEEVSVWRYHTDTQREEQVHWMKGAGVCKWAVGMQGHQVGFTNIHSAEYGRSRLTHSFDLFTHSIDTIKKGDEKNYAPILHELGPYSLRVAKGGEQNYADGVLVVYKDGEELTRIARDRSTGNRVRCFTFTPDTLIAIGGDNGYLEIYYTSGESVANCLGHTGRLWGVAASADGKRLISCGDDQMIKIWDLRGLSEGELIYKDYLPFNDKILKQLKEKYKGISYDNPSPNDIITLYKRLRETKDPLAFKLLVNGNGLTYPLASIFITEDRQDWILWCDDGYFCSSREGSKYIGYHINQGLDKNAKFFPFEQFDLKFNRPDIVNKRLALGEDTYNKSLYQAFKKRLKKMGVEESALSSDIHLPEATLQNASEEVSTSTYLINVSAQDSKYALHKLQVWVNNVPVFGTQGMPIPNQSSVWKGSLPIQLSQGKNWIQVSVVNDKGAESLKGQVKVIYHPQNQRKPNLYLITLGASDYKDKKMNLRYAAKDAEDIQKYYSTTAQPYDKIIALPLLNDKMTKKNVAELKKTLMQSSVDDRVMVFVSGHGVLDAQLDYYLATYDIDFMNPSAGGLAYEALEQLLDSIPARHKVLFLDACHSGEVDKEALELTKASQTEEGEVQFRAVPGQALKHIGLDNSFEMMKLMFSDLRKGSGTTVISSAGGAEYALEGEEWKNGVFTYCLLQGLQQGKADLNQDGQVMLSELQAYLIQKVPELTSGRQKPTSRLENRANDWKVK